MPTKRTVPKVPSYRSRESHAQALVTLTDSVTKMRRDYWLGEYGSPESRELYHRAIAEWEAILSICHDAAGTWRTSADPRLALAHDDPAQPVPKARGYPMLAVRTRSRYSPK